MKVTGCCASGSPKRSERALRIDTGEVKQPVQLLLEAKKLRTGGAGQGTKYFAGKGGARQAAAKKKVAKEAKRKAA